MQQTQLHTVHDVQATNTMQAPLAQSNVQHMLIPLVVHIQCIQWQNATCLNMTQASWPHYHTVQDQIIIDPLLLQLLVHLLQPQAAVAAAPNGPCAPPATAGPSSSVAGRALPPDHPARCHRCCLWVLLRTAAQGA